MKRKNIGSVFGFLIAFLTVAVLAWATTYSYYPYGIETGTSTTNVTMDDSGNIVVDGNATITGTTGLTGNLTRKGEVLTVSTVSLTSPTVSFSAANKGLIVLNSDANQTGVYPTGGSLYQVITIVSGAGSNTMRFDDGTSMTVGSNVTITEGQQDVITLMCMSADGDDWTAVSAHDN